MPTFHPFKKNKAHPVLYACYEWLLQYVPPTTSSSSLIAIALSGGRDSTVLLHALHTLQQRFFPSLRLQVLHVNHGLQAQADVWEAHVVSVAQHFSLPVMTKRVAVPLDSGIGIEAAARQVRYQALIEMLHSCVEQTAQPFTIPLLVTAHHQDDQVESMLLQMLRGTGLAGAAGMAEFGQLPKLPQHVNASVNVSKNAVVAQLGRPLLHLPVAQIADYAQLHQLVWVEDPSNQALMFQRNRLRHTVLPELHKNFPNGANKLAGFARHAAQAQCLLEELALGDLRIITTQQASEPVPFMLAPLQEPTTQAPQEASLMHPPRFLALRWVRQFSEPRQLNLLRYWWYLHMQTRPAERWWDEIFNRLMQPLLGGDNKAWSVHYHNGVLGYAYGYVFCGLVEDFANDDLQGLSKQSVIKKRITDGAPVFFWQGEAQISVEAWQGMWVFERVIVPCMPMHGLVPEQWLREQKLSTRARVGGELLKIHAARPHRTLKNLYQEAQIPPSIRQRLPLLYADETLLCAAGLGVAAQVPIVDTPAVSSDKHTWVRIFWRADHAHPSVCTSK